MPDNNFLYRLLWKQAKENPSNIALVGLEGKKLSYDSFQKAAQDLAELLKRIIPSQQSCTIAFATNDLPAFATITFAAWISGCIIIPLDTRIRCFELGKILEKLSPDILILEQSIANRLKQTMVNAPDHLRQLFHPFESIKKINPVGSSPSMLLILNSLNKGGSSKIYPVNNGLIIYTSGSTSDPKGVLHSLQGIYSNVESIIDYLPVQKKSRVAITLPLHYSYTFIGQILTSLAVGATLIQIDTMFASTYLKRLIDLDISVLSSVSFELKKLLQVPKSSSLGRSVKCIASAGMSFDRHLYEKLKKIFPSAIFFDQYGFAEAGPRVSAISDEDEHFLVGSVGKPINNVSVGLLTSDGIIHKSGKEGILVVKTKSAMIEYVSEPEATKSSFHEGWLLSGDYSHILENGYIYLLGRKQDFANVYGEKISLVEIEDCLKSYPGIMDTAVIALDDQMIGSRIIAFVESTIFNKHSIEEYLVQMLSPQKKPHDLMQIDKIPRSSAGKTLKHKLKICYEQKNQKR